MWGRGENCQARLMSLTLDISFRRLTLGMEGVEVLFESMLGGFPSIDRTSQYPAFRCHPSSPEPKEARAVPFGPGDRPGNA